MSSKLFPTPALTLLQGYNGLSGLPYLIVLCDQSNSNMLFKGIYNMTFQMMSICGGRKGRKGFNPSQIKSVLWVLRNVIQCASSLNGGSQSRSEGAGRGSYA